MQDLESLGNWTHPQPWTPRQRRLAKVASAFVVVVAVLVWIVLSLTPERELMLFDLAIATLGIVGIAFAGRYLIRAEAIRRSRLIAAELIGVTVGGAAIGSVLFTVSGESTGPTKIVPLLIIQLLGAVVGGAAAFLLAFFIAAAVKLAAKLFRDQRPEVEAVFIGVVTGAIGGALTVQIAEDIGAWLPFVTAAVCGASSYRAVILHQRFDSLG